MFSKTKINIIIYLLVFVVIGVGVYCGLKLYEHSSRTSATYGDLVSVNLFEDFNLLELDLSDEAVYSNGNTRTISKSYPVSIEFNGNDNDYNLLVNDSPVTYTYLTYGILFGTYNLEFFDLYGAKAGSISLDLKVEVYLQKVNVSVTAIANDTDYSYFIQYKAFNGLKLRIIEGQYIS